MRIPTAGSAVLAALAVAACGGSASTSTIKNANGSGRASVSGPGARASGTAATQPATTVTRTATVVASGAGQSGSATGGAGRPATSPVPACVASGLALSFLGQQGATGHGELGFALRNTGRASCSTVGYPGVQFLGAGGAALPTTPTHTTSDFFGHTTRRALTVAPGQTVSFRLGVTHGETSGAGCTTASALQVIAPNDTATLTTPIPDGASACATVTISPLQAGESAYP